MDHIGKFAMMIIITTKKTHWEFEKRAPEGGVAEYVVWSVFLATCLAVAKSSAL